jgi:hypothetical protein
MVAKKSATPESKPPRKFSPAKKGDSIKPDDAAVLPQSHTRVKGPTRNVSKRGHGNRRG